MAGENSIETGIGVGEAQILPDIKQADYSDLTNQVLQKQKEKKAEKENKEQAKQKRAGSIDFNTDGIVPQHVRPMSEMINNYTNAYREAVLNNDQEAIDRLEQEKYIYQGGIIESKELNKKLGTFLQDVDKNPELYTDDTKEMYRSFVSGDMFNDAEDPADLNIKLEEFLANIEKRPPVPKWREVYDSMISDVNIMQEWSSEDPNSKTQRDVISASKLEEASLNILNNLSPHQKVQKLKEEGKIDPEIYDAFMSLKDPLDLEGLLESSGVNDKMLEEIRSDLTVRAKESRSDEVKDTSGKGIGTNKTTKSEVLFKGRPIDAVYMNDSLTLKNSNIIKRNAMVNGYEFSASSFQSDNWELETPIGVETGYLNKDDSPEKKFFKNVDGTPTGKMFEGDKEVYIEIAVNQKGNFSNFNEIEYVPYSKNRLKFKNKYGSPEEIKALARKGSEDNTESKESEDNPYDATKYIK